MPSWPVPTVKGCYKNAPSLPNDQFMSMILTGYQICHMKCIVSNFSRLQSFYRIIILKYRQIVCHLTRSFCSHSGITPKHTGVAHGIDKGRQRPFDDGPYQIHKKPIVCDHSRKSRKGHSLLTTYRN